MNELTDQEVDAMFTDYDNRTLEMFEIEPVRRALRIKPINRNDEYRRDYCREEMGVFVGLMNVAKFYGCCAVIVGSLYAIRWAWRML
jgi:hypothetical protein